MKKLFIANSLLLFDFWITIAIPYMVYRGLSLESSVGLISFYAILVTFLEYPTGVIGDYFGHKISVVLGTVCAILSYVLLFFANSYLLFLAALLARALAMTLRSGSTEALLKSQSTSIKKDLSNFSAIEDFMIFIASILAGLIAQVGFNLAIAINIFTAFLSLLIVVTVENKHKFQKDRGNVFALANEGLYQVIGNSKLLIPVFLLMLFYSYGRNVKSIFGIMSETYNFSLGYLGVIVGVGMLVRSLGRYLYGKYKKVSMNAVVVLFLATLLVAGLAKNYWTVVLLILFGNVLMGFILSWLKLDIMEHSTDHTRASVLSFSGLLSTLSGSMYLFLFGKLSIVFSIPTVLMATSIVLSGVYGLGRYLAMLKRAK